MASFVKEYELAYYQHEVFEDVFELTQAEDNDTLYIDVDGTTVELAVKGFPYHADHEWNA